MKTSSDVLHKCQSMAKSQDSLAHLKNSHPLCKSSHSQVCVPVRLEHLSLANSYRSLRSRFLDQNTVFIVDVRLMIKTPFIASNVAAQFVHPAGMRSAPTSKKKAVQACPFGGRVPSGRGEKETGHCWATPADLRPGGSSSFIEEWVGVAPLLRNAPGWLG